MLRPDSLGPNVAAGIVVAMVAIPLNLALAVACDLPPSAGLVSGAIAGLIGALFGGSRLNITGPEVALAPLTALIVATHGFEGMLVATALAGAIQIALGALGVGGVARLLPRPVVGGFLAAVGVMVLDTQVPHLLGVHDGHRIATLHQGFSDDPALHATSIAIGLAVIVALLVVPKVAPRVPAPLVGLTIAVGAVAWLGLAVERVSPLEGAAITFHVPDLASVDLLAIAPSALALAVLASVDSLLCAVSVDARMGTQHRPDQELVAQGVANIACAFFGGMPVAAAVVRSVAAIEARGDSRLCGVVQSIVLLAVLLVLGAHLDLVPLAALAGVLLVVGARLIQIRELVAVARVRRYDALVFVATAVAILTTGFVEGLLVGATLATLELVRAQGASLRAHSRREGERLVLRVEGPLVFASQHRAAHVLSALCAGARSLVVELDGVTQWDASGLGALRTVLAPLRAAGARVEVLAGGAVPRAALVQELAGVAEIGGGPLPERPPAREPARSSIEDLALEGAE